MLRAFRKIISTAPELNQVQDNIRDALTPLLSNPILNGNFIQALTLGAGSNPISHGLGRRFMGWMVGGLNSAVTIYATPSPDPATLLVLQASGPATISLYVF